jgi:hypothetical protein
VRSADLLPECRCPHNGKTELYLQALVFIFLNGNHYSGTSVVDTTIVVCRSDVRWKFDGETMYSSLSFDKMITNGYVWRHRWPCGPRRSSAVVWLLGFRLRIPARAWMFILCVCSGSCDELITQGSPNGCVIYKSRKCGGLNSNWAIAL